MSKETASPSATNVTDTSAAHAEFAETRADVDSFVDELLLQLADADARAQSSGRAFLPVTSDRRAKSKETPD